MYDSYGHEAKDQLLEFTPRLLALSHKAQRQLARMILLRCLLKSPLCAIRFRARKRFYRTTKLKRLVKSSNFRSASPTSPPSQQSRANLLHRSTPRKQTFLRPPRQNADGHRSPRRSPPTARKAKCPSRPPTKRHHRVPKKRPRAQKRHVPKFIAPMLAQRRRRRVDQGPPPWTRESARGKQECLLASTGDVTSRLM